jgi:predicted secreted protein
MSATAKSLWSGGVAALAFVSTAHLLAQIGATSSSAQAASQSNETVALVVGTSTTIVLSETPSTGYRWKLDTARGANLAIVRVIDAGYQVGESSLIGAPGAHRWQIEARVPGAAKVVFAYSRRWEHGPPTKTYVIEIHVMPSR